MYIVPGNSANSEVAWDFLNYISQDEQQLAYFNDASQLRVFGAPYPQVSLAGELTNPLLTPVIDTAPFARSGEVAARAGNITQVDALKEAVNSVIGGTSAEKALGVVKATLTN
jgi:maltose-binding protein MalE